MNKKAGHNPYHCMFTICQRPKKNCVQNISYSNCGTELWDLYDFTRALKTFCVKNISYLNCGTELWDLHEPLNFTLSGSSAA